LTIRGSKLIGEADVVIWARSLVHEDILEYARSDAEIVEATTIPLVGMSELYERAVVEDLKVARVHSGDPSLYGAVMEQIEVCEEVGLCWEIAPGVSSLGAAAAVSPDTVARLERGPTTRSGARWKMPESSFWKRTEFVYGAGGTRSDASRELARANILWRLPIRPEACGWS